tara:strand:+ start:6566 stop:6769 length:204 start_codon:yes stop_codon:yes gene_type:complete
MKTQIELIEHFTKNFNKVVASHGAGSDYATTAFFQMRAAIIGIPEREIFTWAKVEFDRQKQLALEAV